MNGSLEMLKIGFIVEVELGRETNFICAPVKVRLKFFFNLQGITFYHYIQCCFNYIHYTHNLYNVIMCITQTALVIFPSYNGNGNEG